MPRARPRRLAVRAVLVLVLVSVLTCVGLLAMAAGHSPSSPPPRHHEPRPICHPLFRDVCCVEATAPVSIQCELQTPIALYSAAPAERWRALRPPAETVHWPLLRKPRAPPVNASWHPVPESAWACPVKTMIPDTLFDYKLPSIRAPPSIISTVYHSVENLTALLFQGRAAALPPALHTRNFFSTAFPNATLPYIAEMCDAWAERGGAVYTSHALHRLTLRGCDYLSGERLLVHRKDSDPAAASATVVHTPAAISLLGSRWDTFYHWLLVLARAAMLRPLLTAPHVADWAVAVPAPAAWATPWLVDVLGVPPGRIVYVDNATVVHADRWLVPSSPACDNPQRLPLLLLHAWIRKSLTTSRFVGLDLYHTHPDARRPLRVVVVSRRGLSRALINEEELLAALDSHPSLTVTVFTVEQFPSAREQVKLFGTADVIIGPHGAGLTHMVSAPPHTHVLEVRREAHPDEPLCFYAMAAALSLPYWPIPATRRRVVDVSYLVAVIDAIMAGTRAS